MCEQNKYNVLKCLPDAEGKVGGEGFPVYGYSKLSRQRAAFGTPATGPCLLTYCCIFRATL